MDTLGPRIMVNVGTQAASTSGLNPRDLAPLTNDAFLATFMGKTSLSTSNGTSRQQNSYRQSFTTQMERVNIRSKSRPSTSNGDSMEPDSAILSVIRGNGSENHQQSLTQRALHTGRNRRRSLNQQQLLGDFNEIPCSPNYRPANDAGRRRRTRSGGVQQQITVVDQMAAQPHIPYAILPKRFEPKQIPSNGLPQQSRSLNNNTSFNGSRRRRVAAPRRSQRQADYYNDQWEDEEEDSWLEPMGSMMRRRIAPRSGRAFGPATGYYGPRLMPRLDDYYDAYAYGPMSRQGPVPLRSRRRMMYQDDGYLPFDIVPSYDLNEWQGPYARSRQAMYSQGSRAGLRYGREENGFIRDDHRVNGSSRRGRKSVTPTRNGKQAKSPKGKGTQNQPKRRNSRQRKQRNQNSKTEGTPSINVNELKPTANSETSDDDKQKHDTTANHSEQPLPPRDHETKEADC